MGHSVWWSLGYQWRPCSLSPAWILQRSLPVPRCALRPRLRENLVGWSKVPWGGGIVIFLQSPWLGEPQLWSRWRCKCDLLHQLSRNASEPSICLFLDLWLSKYVELAFKQLVHTPSYGVMAVGPNFEENEIRVRLGWGDSLAVEYFKRIYSLIDTSKTMNQCLHSIARLCVQSKENWSLHHLPTALFKIVLPFFSSNLN